jgi:hypothetical protein
MNTMFRTLSPTFIRRAAVLGALATATAAQAQATDPFTAVFAGVNLGTIVALVIAAALVIVSIALAMKGPDVAKRVIRKV